MCLDSVFLSVESEAEPGSFLWRLALGDANSAVGV